MKTKILLLGLALVAIVSVFWETFRQVMICC